MTTPHSNEKTAKARSRVGRYAMTPLWLVLNPNVSDFAIRLYDLIAAKYADREDDTCYPTRRSLATDLGKARSTIDLALAQLKDAGALIVEQQRDAAGDLTANLYTIVFDRPVDSTDGGAPKGLTEKSVHRVDRKIGQPLAGKSVNGGPKNRSVDHRNNQNQEPESINQPSAGADAAALTDEVDFSDALTEPPMTAADVVALYNERLGADLPRCLDALSPKRAAHINARLKEHADRAWWVALFDRVAASTLLAGFVRTDGTLWKPTGLSWFLNVENIAKILEGAYDPRPGQLRQQHASSRGAAPIPAAVVPAEVKHAVVTRIASRGAVLAAIEQLPVDLQAALTQLAVDEVNAEWRGAIDPDNPLYRNTVRGRMAAKLMTFGETLDEAIAAFARRAGTAVA